MDPREFEIRQKMKSEFPYYAPRVLQIKSQEGGMIQFELTAQQRKLHDVAERQLREKGRVRIIVAKGRKTKTSTYVQGRFYWKVTHRRGVKAFVIAHDKETTGELFDITDRFHRRAPAPMKPHASSASVRELTFDELDSGYSVGTAGSLNVGRGFTPHYLHLSEAAYFPAGEEIARGLMTAVADAPGTEIWIESTGNGPGDWFHSQVIAALSGKSDYEVVFLEWWLEPQYASDEPITPDEEELKLLEQHPAMTLRNLAWRRKRIALYGGGDSGKMLFKREFPCNMNDVFASSDASFIEPELVEAAAKRAMLDAPDGSVVVGIDPGGAGDPTALVARRGGRQFYKKVLTEKEPEAVLGRLIVLLRELDARAIFVDTIGMGHFLVAALSVHFPGVRGVDFRRTALEEKRYSNKRAECCDLLKDWLKTASIQDDVLLKIELCVFHYSYRANGQLVIESKDDAKERGHSSPNCFVGGTMVSTPQGPRAIETLRVGDEVLTPLGTRRVIKTWKSTTDRLVDVSFSDGRSVVCTPDHGIFVWGKGWVAAERLCSNNAIESDDEMARREWQSESSKFTWDSVFTFTRLAAISAVAGSKTRRDFCIAASGLTPMDLSPKATTSTTETTTGGTTKSETSNASKAPSIAASTCSSDAPNQAASPQCSAPSARHGKPPRHGTPVRPASSGTASTARKLGSAESSIQRNAPSVRKNSKPRSQRGPSSVRPDACSAQPQSVGPSSTRVVSNAEQSSSTAPMSRDVFVVGSAPIKDSVRTLVFNLTLDEDNVYYANGVLVKNCFDALAITFAEPVDDGVLDESLWMTWPHKPKPGDPLAEGLPACNFITAYAWIADEQWCIAIIGVFVPDIGPQKLAGQKTQMANVIVLKCMDGDGIYHFMDAAKKLWTQYKPDYFYVPARLNVVMKDLRIKNLSVRRAKFETVQDVVGVGLDVLKQRCAWVRNSGLGQKLKARLARYPHGDDEAVYGCIGLALAHLRQRGNLAVQWGGEEEHVPRRRSNVGRRTSY